MMAKQEWKEKQFGRFIENNEIIIEDLEENTLFVIGEKLKVKGKYYVEYWKAPKQKSGHLHIKKIKIPKELTYEEIQRYKIAIIRKYVNDPHFDKVDMNFYNRKENSEQHRIVTENTEHYKGYGIKTLIKTFGEEKENPFEEDVFKSLKKEIKEKKIQKEDHNYNELVEKTIPYYKEGRRQKIALNLSGYLKKKGLGMQSVKSIIKDIGIQTKDKEISMRLKAVEETFKKDNSEIKGISGLDFLNEEENKVKSFLEEKRKKFESLGCGFHNGVYYFGTKVFKEGRGFDAVVTSDKNLYIDKRVRFGKDVSGENEIKTIFGLNYKDPFFDESLDNIFSNNAIKKWMFEDCSGITLEKIYGALVNLFKKYLYFEDERKYSLLACYRIAGFFMPIWKARARLFLYAEMGSAKSRGTNILHNTGFNSVALGDWTLPYVKTIIESTRGETHIDDFETLPEELKNATTRLVKVGYMKGFKAGKMSDGAKRKPEVNDLFNTTTLNNTEGLDFISTDRCETIRIPKISNKNYDKDPNFEDKIWEELRDNLYISGLKYPKEVKEIYEEIKSDKIRGRLFSIIKPELTIAKLISNDLYESLEEFWIEEIKQRNNLDYESDWEFLAYREIYKLYSTLSTTSTLSIHSTLSTTDNYFTLLDDVVKPIGESLYGKEEFEKKKKRSMSIVIGNCLKRNPIFKHRQVKGKTQYKVDFEEFKSLLDAKGFLKVIQGILEEVESVDSEVKVERVERVGGRMYQGTEENINFEEMEI